MAFHGGAADDFPRRAVLGTDGAGHEVTVLGEDSARMLARVNDGGFEHNVHPDRIRYFEDDDETAAD